MALPSYISLCQCLPVFWPTRKKVAFVAYFTSEELRVNLVTPLGKLQVWINALCMAHLEVSFAAAPGGMLFPFPSIKSK